VIHDLARASVLQSKKKSSSTAIFNSTFYYARKCKVCTHSNVGHRPLIKSSSLHASTMNSNVTYGMLLLY
jgi:hypothetical protein